MTTKTAKQLVKEQPKTGTAESGPLTRKVPLPKTSMATQPVPVKIDPSLLKRNRPKEEVEPELEPLDVSAGAVNKIIDLAFNPSREKIREVTVIDRVQGRLFPQLDMINTLRHYILQIAFYRQDKSADKAEFKKLFKLPRPMPPDCTDELLYRIAQWQKSITGKNLDRALDIALAETETKGGEDEGMSAGSDAWKE